MEPHVTITIPQSVLKMFLEAVAHERARLSDIMEDISMQAIQQLQPATNVYETEEPESKEIETEE